MVTFKITLLVKDALEPQVNAELGDVSLTKEELENQIKSGYLDFVGIKVLGVEVEEVAND